MRLLLISHFFPPYNNMGAVRVGKTAKYLTKFGHEVRVITAHPQSFQPTLSVEIPPDHVISTKWINVNKPAEILSGGSTRVAAKGYEPRVPSRRAVHGLRSLYRSLYKSVIAFPDDQIGWLPFALRASSELVHHWKPDLIIGSGPPYTSLLIAHRVARAFHIPWVAELRDLWADSHLFDLPAWRRRLEHRVERRILQSVDGLVTVSEPLADVLRSKYRQPVAVVLNGCDPDDYPSPRPSIPSSTEVLRIVYTGMMMWMGVEKGMDPSPLFHALQRLGPLAEQVRLVFYGRRLDGACAMAASIGVGRLVEIHDQVPYHNALRLQQEADVLLLLLWNDPRQRGIYTGKLFEYLGARRPILAIGPSDNVAADLIRERNAGRVLAHPEHIADQLKQWIQHKQINGMIPSLPPNTTAGLTREEQTVRLDKFLRELVN